MGVHGLTTYLRDNKRNLGQTLTLPSAPPHQRRTVLVVDGWSFIYAISNQDTTSWAYGGEYGDFATQVQAVVKAWWTVGLQPYIVFDGPVPSRKLLTSLTRLQKSRVQPAQLFFRTSQASRSSPRFLNENRIIPPLSYDSCICALKDLRASLENGVQDDVVDAAVLGGQDPTFLEKPALEIFFADGEADDFAVQLASRLGLLNHSDQGADFSAFVAGGDSDFAILNGEGYSGYIPFEEMTWIVEGQAQVNGGDKEDASGFQTVTNKKHRTPGTAASSRGLIPPILPETDGSRPELTLNCTIYKPADLAAKLSIPVPLLPLLGAIVGNDYTLGSAPIGRSSYINASSDAYSSSPKNAITNSLFPRTLSPQDRIPYTAKIIASHLRPATSHSGGKRKKSQAPASVMQLIEMTVASLMATSPVPIGSGEQAQIVERIVEGTLPYALPKPPVDADDNVLPLWPTDACAIHELDICPLAEIFSAEDDLEQDNPRPHRNAVVKMYCSAYHCGTFAPGILDVLSTGTYSPELFLEHPDLEAVSRSIGKEIRLFGYSIINHEIGIPDHADDDSDGDESEDGLEANGAAGYHNETTDTPDTEEDEDEDELIDVVEEDSGSDLDIAAVTNVAQLRGALRNLQVLSSPPSDDEHEEDASDLQGSAMVDDAGSQQTGSMSTNTARRRRKLLKTFVTEYVRKGARVVGEDVAVPLLQTYHDHLPRDFFTNTGAGGGKERTETAHRPNTSVSLDGHVPSLVLASEQTRLGTLLSFLHSDGPAVRAIFKGDAQYIMPILVGRWVVRCMHRRAYNRSDGGVPIPGSGRDKERWTLKEAKALVNAFAGPDLFTGGPNSDARALDAAIPLNDRSIQLTAQALQAVEAISHLVQILLLAEQIPYCGHRFSGRRFHSQLAAINAGEGRANGSVSPNAATAAKLEDALREGMAECFAEESSGGRKAKKKSSQQNVAVKGFNNVTKKKGMFGILSELNDD